MKPSSITLLTLFAVTAYSPPSLAQADQPNPSVLAVIGDISTADARERVMRSVKKKPNSKSCKAGEWEKLGFRHAYEFGPGEPQYDERWAMVQKRCAKSKVTVDKARYDAGYREGSLLYCGYETGIVYGFYFNKDASAPICANLNTPTHDRGYESGKLIQTINIPRRDLKESYEAVRAENAAFLERIDGQPSTVAEKNLFDEANAVTEEIKAEYDIYQARFDALKKTYQLKGIYRRCASEGQCAPDMDINYEIPPLPQIMP